MRYWFFATLLSATLAGCQLNPRAEREIALLRAEILELEDQYYALKSRCEGSPGSSAYYEVEGSSFLPSGGYNESYHDRAPARTPDQSELKSVREDFGEPTLQIQEQPPDSSRFRSRPRQSPTQDRGSHSTDSADTTSIRRIAIHPHQSRGQDLDGQPGHEGLVLLLQPLDERGRTRPWAAPVTIRVVENESESISRQLALWQFTRDEIEPFLVHRGAEPGILLHLPWDGLIPMGNSLNVFVEYETSDRRLLETSLALTVEPPPHAYAIDHPLMATWLEHDERWTGPQAHHEIQSNQRPSAAGHNPITTDDQAALPQWRPIR